MHPFPKGFMLEAITQKVDGSAVAHPNGTKVAGTFADRPHHLMRGNSMVSKGVNYYNVC